MKYSLRFVWYVLKFVIIALSAFAILAAVFFIAMDSADVYVIVTDGMKARATQALVPGQSVDLLPKYFTDNFQKTQPSIDTTPYSNFAITGIRYKLDVESLWCNPWTNKATVTVVESIPEISYNVPLDTPEGAKSPVPPQWQRARYKLTCVRSGDIWRIDKMEKLENLPPEPTPTPEPSAYITASPLPTATASSTPGVQPTASTQPTPTVKG
jgi:hypothetical protein